MTDNSSVIDLAQAEAYRNRYLADQIETATPEQRLLMLFDKLLLDLDDAAEGIRTGAIEATSNALVHGQEILFALRDPLDRETPLGAALSATYTFCLSGLIEVNLSKRAGQLERIRQMIADIATANRRAAAENALQARGGMFEGVA